MPSGKATALAAATLLALLVVAPAVASAQRSLDCQKVWDGPSIDNDVLKCLSNTDRIKGQWRYLVYPGFCALLFVVTLLSFPLVFLSVVCCRSCGQPKPGRSSDASRCFLWMWVIYVVLWSAAMAVLVILGAKLLATSAPSIIDNTLDGPLQYFNNTAERIIDFTSNWSSGKREPIPSIDLDITAFTNISTNVTDLLMDAKQKISKYIGWVPIVSYCVGGVGVVLMLLVVFLACCRCGIPCTTYLFSCVYWLFGVVFALLAVVVTVLAYLSWAACGEVELQQRRQPGVFQWYLVPYCEQTFDFADINREADDAERRFSKEACKNLLKSCDNNTISFKPLLCGNDITSEDQCPNFGTMASVLSATRIKAFTMACPVAGESCTLFECAANCTNTDVKAVASGILQLAAQASNASIALSYARPLLDCNFVVDKLLGAMSDCNELKAGTLMLGTGFFVGGLMFGLAIYIMFRGSCIWDARFIKQGTSPRGLNGSGSVNAA
ncbi:hypothetical protein C3747_11g522 [Trypanosoma cruzi]|uniref:Uncharacterized protein n=1 Tax=Trypanosoma cruzi TaxID=5693 RepID=A0A2V2XFP4_TRYCR|nr:hypothetical protein C3747_11g522 [Trypanosoma cruzi]